jgi:hypothetical protein
VPKKMMFNRFRQSLNLAKPDTLLKHVVYM